jgi:hypothetical protein
VLRVVEAELKEGFLVSDGVAVRDPVKWLSQGAYTWPFVKTLCSGRHAMGLLKLVLAKIYSRSGGEI